MTELWAILLVLGACVIGSFGPILIKKGVNKHKERPAPVKKGLAGLIHLALSLATNWRIIAGIGCYGVSSILFIPALRGGDLSVLYPLVASSYIWVSIWSVIFLKERMTTLKIVGIGIIIAGISVIGLSA
jgi:multidrug transporter EmrE-like cation transporter